ncbi:hypothetical protein KTF56_10390 [Burkholderia gladioli]|uniref:hypothetical protein n=1 Tax=Burkholderia gladioli TaxID=28095 RepID=UPI001C245DF5|nr:hypothetical protein [Burkholderia gladioli]MBU9683294.1 hypothetical protein [Burkholderia gladioli]
MGKKKRKKSFRTQHTKPQVFNEMRRLREEKIKHLDKAFEASCDQVRAVLTRFHPMDVLAAINVSDLWQPNRASQVKHQLAFCLLVSLEADHFMRVRMTSYEDFSEFCKALMEALPAFPTLEDYVPEPDWGDVKVLLGGEPVAILHGGPVQRVADYIEAFRIDHGEGSQAVAELDSATRLQAELLRRIPSNVGDYEPMPGHIEVPSRFFWEVAMPALQVPFGGFEIANRYVADLGQRATWRGISAFGDAILSGTALPWATVRIDDVLYAMSLRNVATVVIEAWAQSPRDAPVRVAARLNAYLAKRIKHHVYLPGPLLLRSQNEVAPLPISGVLTEGEQLFMIVPVSSSQWAQAGKAVATMRRLMRDKIWGLQLLGTSEGFQLGEVRGAALGPDTVNIVLVKTQVSTGLSISNVPSADARLMNLVDACTIFDCIESVEEFRRFWAYVDGLEKMGGGGLSDLVDLFGSFRDVHEQILDGAVVPNFLTLDPHWGASWRYEQLKTFWRQAPLRFPDEQSAWETYEHGTTSSLMRLTAKNASKLAWSSVIGSCTLHFTFDVEAVGLEPADGQLLELFIHCAADSIAERASIIAPYLQLPTPRITLDCFSASNLLPSSTAQQCQEAATMPLITVWEETQSVDGTKSYDARLTVNLVRVSRDLEASEDASFEVACVTTVVKHLFEALGASIPVALVEALASTASRRPRFTLTHARRTVDVPDFTDAQVPRLADYKVARRELAFLFKDQGVTPGTYMLEDAKALINPARAAYRDAVHQRIRVLDRDSLLSYCVGQYDAVIASYDRNEHMLKLSLLHEVDFDREQDLAEAHDKFVRESRNFRYLLESAVVLAKPQPTPVGAEEIMSILAMVDWLFVLYGASDVLHNGIDVGGLRVDSQFVPEVFYSESRNAQEEAFRLEQAALRLGVNVTEEDKVSTSLSIEAYTAALDTAFEKDLHFTYSHLLNVLSTLTQWISVGGGKELACGYISGRQAIADRVVLVHPDCPKDAALAVLDFLVLDPDQVWRLIGVELVTDDVPVWEHVKRGCRHTIRPLIMLSDGQLLWGAAAVGRAMRIWTGTISAGYLPADYPWPEVRAMVSRLKKELEDGLEDRAHVVCARVLPYALKGIDFKRRFPREISGCG